MKGQINPRIVGASVIGFALVAGAYTIANFNTPHNSIRQEASIRNTASTPRISIEVSDNDKNGIEDWRDSLITTAPVILNQDLTDYTAPETLTGQMSIDFMETIIQAKSYGSFGTSQEEIIEKTVTQLEEKTTQTLYTIDDLNIMSNWVDQDVINYANTAAIVLINNNETGLAGEAVILREILSSNDTSRLSELHTLMDVYRNNRDDTLNLPVPKTLVKEHLDLINTYHAIYTDIEAMASTYDDPTVTLLRLRRYQDDASALGYALQNMLFALDTTKVAFSVEDPALLFAIFSPDYKI